jgi:hypothetical protein
MMRAVIAREPKPTHHGLYRARKSTAAVADDT